MKHEMMGWQWHQLDHICRSFAPLSRQITTPAPHHSIFTGRPTNSVNALKSNSTVYWGIHKMLLQNAPIVREWVGLRPTRKALRVEHELMKFPSGSLEVPVSESTSVKSTGRPLILFLDFLRWIIAADFLQTRCPSQPIVSKPWREQS